MNLKKPNKLQAGDKVAIVALSCGISGDKMFRWRYDLGKSVLASTFKLEVVEMENTLKGSDYLYEHPEKRAEDLMNAFKDPTIKAIFTDFGGVETIRLLPFIDFDIISKNPKIFIGYSDTTSNHFMLLKASVSSFYGPAILSDFAMAGGLMEYTKTWLTKVLFTNEIIGEIPASTHFTNDNSFPWSFEDQDIPLRLIENPGYEFLQGRGKVQGHLIGGCIETLESLKGTCLWPEIDKWRDAIVFFETSEDFPPPHFVESWLRNYATQGILQIIKGIIDRKSVV